jgi:hypothetical protein
MSENLKGADEIVSERQSANAESQTDSLGEEVKPLRGLARIYRSPIFNVIIVGLVSFTQPGIWNALNSQSLHPNHVPKSVC